MIRPYHHSDLNKLLEILRLNIPKYFDPSEEQDLIDYLENELEDYFVFEQDGEILGAGGINYFLKDGIARISWDFVHPESQGQGIGSQLTRFRIERIKQISAIQTIIVRTSQHVYPYYEKLGFNLVNVEKDFWAKGFDLYGMKMELD